ncbi:LysR family transcriptional regulator [Burkholderia ubonensis]|uniref:LysR family transcriptional regulator n=1 Tax=Burkholderia ubonensis TaxID=101571 RepID=UPI00016A62FB|nr:LysR family transcriptional regulator [Burkholderia ubonensis]
MERLKALEVFKAVVDHGSFTRAADATHMGVPSVSRAVQDLETMLGVQLFNRTTRKVALTTAGHAVLERVAGVLASYEDLARAGSDEAGDCAGNIRIEVSTMFDTGRLASVLVRFMRAWPKVRVDVRRVDHQTDALGDLADLAIVVGRAAPPSCIARALADVPLGLYASPAWVERVGAVAHPRDVQPESCLATGAQQSMWTLVDERSGEHATLSARAALRTNCPHALVAAAVDGEGVAILPEHLAHAPVVRGELVRVLDAWQVEPLDACVVYRSRRNLPARIRKLTDCLLDAFGEPRDDAGVTAYARQGGRIAATHAQPTSCAA